MRKLQAGIAGALILTMAVVVANAQEKATTKASNTTAKSTAASTTGPKQIIGEVIDPACWVINGAKGEAHKECAIACARAGQTLAILERKTNKVYILASERPGDDPNKAVMDYIAQAVLVKGKVYSRGGLMAIQVASIEPAPKNAPK
ncbi:MAG: hypothetical protein ACRENN_09780 [Candidatus Eiseniibacteriota bacterium]